MKINQSFLFFFALVAAGLGVAAYFLFENIFLKESNSVLENEITWITGSFTAAVRGLNNDIKNLNAVIDSTKSELATTTQALVATQDTLATTTIELYDCQMAYNLEKSRMDGFGSQISDIKGTVNVLEKIKQTDKELLKKYSKVYFLNENYIPESFAKIDPGYTFNPNEDYLINSKIAPSLNALLATAKADNINFKVVSAYRSFGAQNSLKSSYKMIYGSGANKFSADQGFSEHQLGTTVDLTTPQAGAGFDDFEKTDAYQWLLGNAHTYGFVLSYPQNNKYYQFEPWHWRYVGKALAKRLHDDGKNFYDLDQREIDQYQASFFD
ncbi:MAG: M15 family metallopeptidase [Candidatus Paceibacterota bacterium]